VTRTNETQKANTEHNVRSEQSAKGVELKGEERKKRDVEKPMFHPTTV